LAALCAVRSAACSIGDPARECLLTYGRRSGMRTPTTRRTRAAAARVAAFRKSGTTGRYQWLPEAPAIGAIPHG